VVLLAGLGNTAHIFDDFAPKLTAGYHVYGITRRGYGTPSVPASGYTADRLGNDVLAVLDSLNLNRPVLVGHSIAGEELSSVGSRRPERVGGLIYLDAAYSYAYYDRSRGDFNIDLQELQRKLEQLQKRPPNPKQLIDELLQETLPVFEMDLRELQKYQQTRPAPMRQPPAPTAADRVSYRAWRSRQERVSGFAMPEAELRQIHETTPEGHVGELTTKPGVAQAINAGQQKYTHIEVPLFALPHDPGRFANVNNDPVTLAAFETSDAARTEASAKAFESGVPSARVVRLAHANHYIFQSNEADVLREIRAFLSGLQ
jgi:pimeloyl-ACP methyl ester carboxylesterase